ncbi:MAG: pyruvate ferredoxin oxidoreductase alpha subunit [Clostridia bacterium]|jgi:pyruvate ferredoxin oxidoreductase alpha subunit|nr:pyruvate ferredoxin oxidoreductase alpha subunit [Clostridia bacterium]MDN5323127.1 pyruvate ferredoxin oxidoreductase alpha subunit [Clostridia bacterium]
MSAIELRNENKKFLSGDEAVAEGVKLCRPDVIAAYPITPQTVIVEKLSEFVASKEMDCQYLHVESEHSAMAASMGASMMGSRTFTATSSQGLLYMCEMLHYVSGSRFPIVMVNANRTVAAPWNIFGDHRDSLSQRDSGWMQVYVENGQEALDMVIQSYKIAENQSVSTPIMINLDGFVLTHTYELVSIPEQNQVDEFLPPYSTTNKFDFENPKSLCFTASPEWQTEFRYQQYEAMENAKKVIQEVDKEFSQVFGRTYGGMVEEYHCSDADYILVAMGSVAGTAKIVVDKLRKQGKKVGLVKLRFYRPFPKEYFKKLGKKAKAVGVIDRDISFGYEGAVYSDVKAALFSQGADVKTINFIAGISGRDITKEFLAEMYSQLEAIGNGDKVEEIQFTGLRWK